MKKINWKNVFNTEHKSYNTFIDAVNAAKKAGYPYFLWNNKVFRCSDMLNTNWILIGDNVFFDTSVDDDEMLFI